MGDHIRNFFEALRRGHRFATRDIWRIGRPGEKIPRGFIIKQIRVAILLVSNVVHGMLMLRAAALTFATLLAIVPCLAILFYMIQTFGLDEAIFEAAKVKVNQAVESAAELLAKNDDAGSAPDAEGVDADDTETGIEAGLEPGAEVETLEEGSPDSGSVEGLLPGASPPATPANPRDAQDAASLEFRKLLRQFFVPTSSGSDEDYVDPVEELFGLADKLADEAANNPGALLVSGIILFFTTVLGLMRNIETSFNHIWGLSRTRSWFRMIGDYMLITILLPFVGAAVLGVSAALQSETVSVSLGALSPLLWVLQYAMVCLVFSALYFVVPNTKVRPSCALLGGVVAGCLWLFLAWGYVEFQFGITRNIVVYAAFAQIPLLLMWIYSSWIILLFGCEVSYAYQNEETFAMERFAGEATYAYRETLGLRAMLDVGLRFDEGRPGLDPESAAKELNVPHRLLTETLDHLEDAGLVAACATDPVTYQPAKALGKLTVGEIVTTLREVGRDPSLLREDETYAPLLDGVRADSLAESDATIAELIARLHEEVTESSTVPFDQTTEKGGQA
jgi:membrane protein